MRLTKHITTTALLAILLMTFTSCFNFVEEIFLKKDGSGKYTLTMDMSSIMQMGEGLGDMDGMFEGLLDEKKEGTWSDIPEEDTDDDIEEPENKEPQIIDSIMTVAVFLEGKDVEIQNPEFWEEKVRVRMQINDVEKLLKTTFILDFESVDDINYFYENFGTVAQGSEALGGTSGTEEMFEGVAFEKKGKKIIRTSERSSPKESMSKEDKEMWNMMKMFMGTATIKLVIHLEDAKVKKVSNERAKVSEDKKKVTMKMGLMDYIEGNKSFATTIKYK